MIDADSNHSCIISTIMPEKADPPPPGERRAAALSILSLQHIDLRINSFHACFALRGGARARAGP
jgi:hypothetical protein